MARVLIADDASFMRQMIREIIEPEGHEVVGEATNGIEALDAIASAQIPFDLVLMDMQMPVMDGYTATMQLRRDGFTRPIIALQPDLVTMDIVMPKRSGIDAVKTILAEQPAACIVMCSALGQETLVMEALQAGARDFIVKPFKPDSVIATLKKILEKAD